jgi:hypothetical protein
VSESGRAAAPPASHRGASEANGRAATPRAGATRLAAAKTPRDAPSVFRSILFDQPEPTAGVDDAATPAFFADLQLDRVVGSITKGREEYDLVPLYRAPLHSVATINYRHEVFRDLENKTVLDDIRSFATKLRWMRRHRALVGKLHFARQQQRWYLRAVEDYCDAVKCLAGDLSKARLRSHGMLAFRVYLLSYATSPAFTTLVEQTTKVANDLVGLQYNLHIKGNRITVTSYNDQADQGAEVDETFARFKQGAVKDYRVASPAGPADMNHVEAQVLDLVARIHPEPFRALQEYCANTSAYTDPTILTFDREIQFYVAYREYLERLERPALRFCYPRVSDGSKAIRARDAFDIALADKLSGDDETVVCNDFQLDDRERVFVVSGPNNGGKTTFARTFGQLHYLAALGCQVPGNEAQLFLFDQMFAHFEREEDLATLRGKLEDELYRIHEILEVATPNSIIIMNESFGSTTLQDARLLGAKVLERITQLDLLCVYVTFVDELASLNEKIVSMTSMVDPGDPTMRTFKLERRPADGRAYAAALAQKYRLDYDTLKAGVAR